MVGVRLRTPLRLSLRGLPASGGEAGRPSCHPERLASRRGELCEGSRPAEPTKGRRLPQGEVPSLTGENHEREGRSDRSRERELHQRAGRGLAPARVGYGAGAGRYRCRGAGRCGGAGAKADPGEEGGDRSDREHRSARGAEGRDRGHLYRRGRRPPGMGTGCLHPPQVRHLPARWRQRHAGRDLARPADDPGDGRGGERRARPGPDRALLQLWQPDAPGLPGDPQGNGRECDRAVPRGVPRRPRAGRAPGCQPRSLQVHRRRREPPDLVHRGASGRR